MSPTKQICPPKNAYMLPTCRPPVCFLNKKGLHVAYMSPTQCPLSVSPTCRPHNAHLVSRPHVAHQTPTSFLPSARTMIFSKLGSHAGACLISSSLSLHCTPLPHCQIQKVKEKAKATRRDRRDEFSTDSGHPPVLSLVLK